MNTYYIVFEKHFAKLTTSYFSWVIRKTPNDMDTVNGIQAEISIMETEYQCDIRITNWKKLNNENWLTRLLKWCKLKLF